MGLDDPTITFKADQGIKAALFAEADRSDLETSKLLRRYVCERLITEQAILCLKLCGFNATKAALTDALANTKVG